MTKFKTIHIEMLFNPKGEPVCLTRSNMCMFLAGQRFSTESICCYQSQNVPLETSDWVYPHDKCVVHTEEE